MKSILIDDDPAANIVLSDLLRRHCPHLKISALCTSGPEGIETVRRDQPDLVFLDVEMPGMTGMEMLMQLQPLDFEVVFVSAHDQYARQAIRLSALDYLSKPPLAEEVMAAVLKAGQRHQDRERLKRYELLFDTLHLRSLQQRPNRIALPASHNAVEYVHIHQIAYIEADRSYSNFYLTDGRKVLTARNIGEYEDLLSECSFVRTHRSFLVNLEQVRYYRKGEEKLELFDGTLVDVAKSEKENLVKKLSGR